MRKLLIPAVILVITSAVIWGLYEFLQYKDVTFNLSDNISKVEIYIKDENAEEKPVIGTVTKDKPTIKLRVGSYEYTPSGDKISKKPVNFSVKNTESITVDPSYSESYLDSIAKNELSALSQALTAKYPSQMQRFQANNTKLFGKGEWAGVLLTPVNMDPSSPGGYYRVLAQKKSGSWEIVSTPEIVLTKHNTPNIPIDILTSVNNIAIR
jgi:hypothetical protein